MAYVTRRLDPAPPAATVPGAAPTPTPRVRPGARVAHALAVVLAVAAAHLASSDAAPAADPDLALLMRGMALTKALMALAALGLVGWRLRVGAVRVPVLLGLVAASAMLAAGPVLMWHVAHLGTAAGVFHGGLLLLLVVAWADRRATGEALARLVEARRRAGTAPGR